MCGSNAVHFAHLQKLKYIDASLKEALRLKSTAPAWTVQAKEDNTILGGKYKVNKGEPIFIALDALHRDPEVWGNDAEDFRQVESKAERIRQQLILVVVLKGQSGCWMANLKLCHLTAGNRSVGTRATMRVFSRKADSKVSSSGNGVRACIGRAFAWQESLLVVAMVGTIMCCSIASIDFCLAIDIPTFRR